MLVENVKGSSKVSEKPPYPYTSWLNYWEEYTGYRLTNYTVYPCPACGISVYRKGLEGCHVRKANNPFDSKWYIVPLCDRCNHSTEKLDVGNIPLVPTPSNL